MLQYSRGLRITKRGTSVDLLVLLAADYANVEKSGKLNVMGIFSQIYASKFPVRHPEMHVIVSLSASPAEYNTTRKLTVKLMDEDGKQEILSWSRDIRVPAGSGMRRLEVNQILRLRDVVFPEPGSYQFSVLVDNDEKGTLPIFLVQREPTGT